MPSYSELVSKKPQFIGTKRYCNICGYRFSAFNQYGVVPRESACPVCYSLERHRHLYIHILSLYPFLNEKKILHFAPEKIIKDIFLNSPAEYYDADYDPQKATHQVDITNIPFNENNFDYIFCIHVLEHIVDDIKAMKQLFKVLKPGGTAYLSVPIHKKFFENNSIITPEERLIFFGQSDHVRRYDLDTFIERLKIAGFNTELMSKSGNFPKNMIDALLGDTIILARKL